MNMRFKWLWVLLSIGYYYATFNFMLTPFETLICFVGSGWSMLMSIKH